MAEDSEGGMKNASVRDETVTCPFCSATNFDLPGLKYHLTFYCQEYDETAVLITVDFAIFTDAREH
jgi:hypothetical protein